MSEGISLNLSLSMGLLVLFLLLLCFHESCCSSMYNLKGHISVNRRVDDLLPEIPPSEAPQPFLPLLAPSPLAPFTNSTVPKLSGHCFLNFTAAESLMSMTSIDCHAVFAPLLANVVCCPQLEATILILIGQSSRKTNMLALNGTLAEHCLSDFEQILVGQGAADDLKKICSINASNLTEASCPVKDVNEFESTVDSSKLLAACEKVDPVKECCDQICQNAILEAATKIAMKASDPLNMEGHNVLSDHSTRINDCKSIVLRWLGSKLDPSRSKEVLRGLSNCNVNKVCPLSFPSTKHLAKSCGDNISNQSACCNAMESYVSHLQKQSLITNLQALDCATLLGTKLQKSSITADVFKLCHISLKDFTLQAAGNQAESGCLLPSLPSDATFDKSSGISFICDLNDNIPAPWPSSSRLPTQSCNSSVRIPALPAAASAQSGLYNEALKFYQLFASSAILLMLI
ncbi:putative GPI-anchored protein [Citrus sinensis]|nr:putative GPI-anchored protein [Citrus sinensis]